MIDPAFLREVQARTSIAAVIGSRIALRRRGHEHKGLCPFHQEKTGSFTVNEGKAFWHCFGCAANGDAIDFVRRFDNLSFHAAVMRLAIEAGLAPDNGEQRPLAPAVKRPSAAELDAEKAHYVEWARNLWGGAKRAEGTLVVTYLRARGITIDPPPSLRYSAGAKHRETGLVLPAMIAAVQGPDGKVTGIHRTFLSAGGHSKAGVESPKKMAGVCWGGATRFAKAAHTLALAEGIETALSVRQAMPELAVWAALSLGNIAGGTSGVGPQHPRLPDKKLPSTEPDMERPGIVLPDIVRDVVLCADSDNGDPESAEALLQRAVRRFVAQGRTVRVARAPEGCDFNDVLIGKTDASSQAAA